MSDVLSVLLVTLAAVALLVAVLRAVTRRHEPTPDPTDASAGETAQLPTELVDDLTIGKAVTYEVEGSYVLVGADVARMYGEHEDVVRAIAAHHDEVAPTTVEALLTQAADASCGGRPGARREAAQEHAHRLARLEEIAR